MLAVLGLAHIIFDIGVSDPVNRFVMATGWVIAVRDLGFIAATLAIGFAAIAVSDLFRGKDGAARTVILVTVFLTSLVGAAIFRSQLRSQLSAEALDEHVAATFLGLAVLGLVALAVVQAVRSADDVRVGAARLLGFGALIYMFFGITLSQARDGSWMRGISPEIAGRVDTLLIVAGIVLFLSAISVLQFMRFRATRRLDASEHRRMWAAERVAVALDARVRLQSAEWQWIGTASVLARLVQHPFGVAHPAVSGSVLGVEDPEVLKGVRATLLLTNAGREAIDAKLRSILITPSWLRQQYELLVREFQAILARRTGNAVSDLQDRRPEQDVHAPILESGGGFDASLLRGDRWEFARRVAAGEFDRVLARSADSLDLEEVYGPLLAEPGAMLLEGDPSEDGEGLVRDFIQRLLPTEPPQVPSGVTDVLFSGEDERRRMATWIWWPEGLLGELVTSSFTVGPTRFVRERAEGALVVTAIRLDLSDPFRHDQCFVIHANRQVADITRAS
jgi:type II secretory pathway pseudopilin PulG